MKETITEQLYPDDKKINDYLSMKNAFGWELVSNQRVQERRGDSIYTFNKLTLSREKSEPWYDRVAALERRYDQIEVELKTKKKSFVRRPGFAWWGVLLYFLYFLPGLIYTLSYISKRNNYNKNIDKINAENKRLEEEIEMLKKEQQECYDEAGRLMRGM